jgi:hypothetical protein
LNSVGPVRLVDATAASRDFAATKRLLERSPVCKDAAHAKALEPSVDGGCPQWLGLPVSASDPPRTLDFGIVEDLAVVCRECGGSSSAG